MRRVIVLLLGFLVLTSVMGATASVTSAHMASATDDPDPDRESGEGVYYERVDQGLDLNGIELELYRFTFDPFAYLPGPGVPQDRTNGQPVPSQAMTVFVDEGYFALYTPEELAPGDVVVVTGNDRELRLETWSNGSRQGDEACQSPCEVPGNRYVLLKTGDYVFYNGGAYCPICNDSSNNVGTVYVAAVLVPDEGQDDGQDVFQDVLSWTLADRVAEGSAERGTLVDEEDRNLLDDTPPCGGRYG